MIGFIKRWLKTATHKHKWEVHHDPIHNPKNLCVYTTFKCECGQVALHKEYPDGYKFIGFLK